MRALAWPLLAALLLAGCAKEEAPLTEAVAAVVGPSAEELARMPGALQGIVHTPALEPVPNATLRIARENRTAVTDAVGHFRFDDLPAGQHLVTVEAAGFATRSVLAAARNGTVLEVEILLEPTGSMEPYAETRELAGFLSCSLRAAGASHDCASADPNHRDIFEFELQPEGKLVVLELAWDAEANPTAPELTLAAETVGYGAQDMDLGNATGAGRVRLVVPTEVLEKYYPEGGIMRAHVSLPPSSAPTLAAQTRFVVYVTTFYHEAGPEDFTLGAQP